MSKIADILKQELENLNKSIRVDINDHTGQTANSLKIKVSERKGSVTGISYGEKQIEYLDRGSGPWDNPERFTVLGYILDNSGWADARGVNAYAAAHSIAYKGSQIFRGLKKGLQLDEKINNFEKELNKKLSGTLKAVMLEKITDSYKNKKS